MGEEKLPNPVAGTQVTGEEAGSPPAGGRWYVFRLYITAASPSSRRAIENLRRLCNDFLDGRCDLEIIDIYEDPEAAAQARVLATPTLVKTLPLPVRRFIGDLSDRERILTALEVIPVEPEARPRA